MEPTVRSQYRLPAEVDGWLKDAAKAERRSKNAMLVEFLRMMMSQKGKAPNA